ncbi:putative aldouronate transport system substrate-binding protein [Anaerobacterium chartisolvens]|uniref:Putative aldouronate transport system substrate-binding protein n=1 Tax=Anaerobacterium chartisolvens TaxID=1297424 RepID=A0A369B3L4_9FIRM|nr:ABC transporter substrate-binding protein [Anaerobacterium chartisolvens]RCX16021.1 putative aldouronate transport system substrate-binding protein [Anaerobacterium chartisolvens]
MKKRILSLVLALTLIISVLAGCGNGSSAPDDSTKGAGTEQSGSDGANSENGPPTELSMVALIFSNPPADMNLVVDEINKISKEKINATIKLTPINVGAYAQQVKLMLAGNEKIDLLATGVLGPIFDYYGQTRNGQLMELDDLLDKYGQDIKSVIGENMIVGTQKGKVYAVPNYHDFANSIRLFMRKDMVEKHNIDITKIKTLDDMEAVFKVIKEKEPGITPHMFGQDAQQGLDQAFSIPGGDYLGDWFGVLMDLNTPKVSNYYESQLYADTLKVARRWYTSGYVLKDSATNSEPAQSLMRSGKIFSFSQAGKPGIDGQISLQTGIPVVSAEIVPAQSLTSNLMTFMWGIPSYSKNSEKAMQFLNLMFSDKDIHNLFAWGIEGKHYVKTEDGVIDYPEGVNAQNTGYALHSAFEFGNQFLSHVWKGDAPDLWKQMDEFNKSANKSVALGFSFDSSSVKNEMTALQNVYGQYVRAMGSGIMDPDKSLPDFIDKLKKAGIDKVIAEKQRQLDEFLKSK